MQQAKSPINEVLPTLLAVVPYAQQFQTIKKTPSFPSLDPISESLLLNGPGLIDWKNRDSEFLGCNYDVARIVGLKSPTDIVGKRDEDFVWGRCGHDEVIRKVDQLTLQGNIIYDICRVVHPDKERLLVAKKIPLWNKKKQVIGLVDYLMEIDDSSLARIIADLNKLNIPINTNTLQLIKQYARKDQQYNLNERQKECLYYLIRGSTSKQIAKVLELSPRTIDDHIDSLREIFKCANRNALISKAIILGYLDVIPESIIIKKILNTSINKKLL